ncbi:MAG: ABC transporter substrate-binding protein [Rhodospirillales bacterium]
MHKLTRRAAVAGLGTAVAAGPRRAKAAETVTVWWTQGFYKAENDAVIAAMSKWEKETGNKVNLTIMNGADLISKMIAAMQVGDVPDLVHAVTGDRFLVPLAAWNNKLVDVSDVIASQQTAFSKTALDSSSFYNATAKKHSFYTVPIKCSTLLEQVWRPLVEEAGFGDKDIPTTQDKYYEFFQIVQDKLRSKGKRIFGLGFSLATKEADSGTLFHNFLVAYGGTGIVLPDGRLNIDDANVRKAAAMAIDRLAGPYKKGYVPPGAINWGDVDNNNAFFAKQIAMTPNATISISVAQIDKEDQYYKQIVTQGIPDDNSGKPVASLLGVSPCLIPKDAKNIAGAKSLLKAFIQPANLNTYLKETFGRYLPVMPSIVANDPWWTDPKDPHRPVAVKTGLVNPTIPWWMNYNPAYSAVLSEQIWNQAIANVLQKNMTVDQSLDEAVGRVKTIFERYKLG